MVAVGLGWFDGEVVEYEGLRLGFVGGGLVSPMRTPYELTPEDYADKIAELGSPLTDSQMATIKGAEGGGTQPSGNTTKSGVKWSIEP